MIILHYMSDEDNEVKLETFSKVEEAEEYIEKHEITEGYSLVEGTLLDIG